ncbi:hypothetical protein IU438_28695 [Nocardia cyriacigeorgica]|uniref:hypothetical protein n=1 Tax=Nocardia cyriacigeorgica TaxID=135487 RepID=UPI0018935194|nr:hypothetical protein [Nocardia cyriacigeorgica]MBF6399751.1 hypothetical protein [Nocardia cyriacigeorgica]MBF6405420.1 hypothetical protein [Nocardia cyriacigeorgica]
MSPLAHFIQVVIVAAAVVGVLFMLAAQAIADYLNGALRAVSVDVCGWCGGGGCDECDPDQRRYDPDVPGPCAWHWTTDGSPCGCDPDADADELEFDEPDGAAEWDRARDRALDVEAGVL